MSIKHPIIAVTGSSGAGTTSVTRTFQWIFRRERINAAIVEGDAFHRFNRVEMKAAMAEATRQGNATLQPLRSGGNLFERAGDAVPRLRRKRRGRVAQVSARRARGGAVQRRSPAPSRPGRTCRPSTDLLFYEGLHGGVVTDQRRTSRSHADLLVGVVPIINLEWIQKLHRDKARAATPPRRWWTRSCGACPTT